MTTIRGEEPPRERSIAAYTELTVEVGVYLDRAISRLARERGLDVSTHVESYIKGYGDRFEALLTSQFANDPALNAARKIAEKDAGKARGWFPFESEDDPIGPLPPEPDTAVAERFLRLPTRYIEIIERVALRGARVRTFAERRALIDQQIEKLLKRIVVEVALQGDVAEIPDSSATVAKRA